MQVLHKRGYVRSEIVAAWELFFEQSRISSVIIKHNEIISAVIQRLRIALYTEKHVTRAEITVFSTNPEGDIFKWF